MDTIKIVDLRQRHAEAYWKGMAEVNKQQPAASYLGETLRVMIRAGLLEGLAVEDVAELKPGKVIKLVTEVKKALDQATKVDPN